MLPLPSMLYSNVINLWCVSVCVCHILLSHSNIAVSDSVVSFLLHICTVAPSRFLVCFSLTENSVWFRGSVNVLQYLHKCVYTAKKQQQQQQHTTVFCYCFVLLFWCDNRLVVLCVWSSKTTCTHRVVTS